ncbi:hypothetical protein CVIRNUC_001653 [Coccomyxa viridis]|uniref:Ketoreductase domain-containing protein n=1 Tax=Coccomyxa viridis TaxID=1274662 RepID=A0AAV1HY51_9CHLO|nr:hypothetical protein CVIRNUC_001653 [Coccomyxa viridis]
MSPKIVLITGASSGIGLALAELLARSKEYTVIATARKPEVIKGKAEAGNFHVKQLDVTDEASVRKCIAETIKEFGRLDVLVNNAGFGTRKNVEQMDVKEHQALFDTNYFGVVRMLKETLPHMRAARKGQVIVVTSLVGFKGFAFTDAYTASKFALEGLCESLAPPLATFGIGLSLVEPGPVSTPFMENIPKNAEKAAAAHEEAKGELDEVTALRDAYWESAMKRMFNVEGISQTAEQVADMLKEAIDDAKPHLRYQTSDYVRSEAAKKLVDPTGDAQVEEALEMLKSA